MTYEHYFDTLCKANQDSPQAFLDALRVIVEMERNRKEFEEEENASKDSQ